MAVSILLAKQVLKLFLILLLGYILVKSGKLKASDSKSVSVILVYLVIPCMIINSFQIDYTPQVRNGLIFTMAVSVAVHIVFLALTAALRKPLSLKTVEELTVVYSNAGILVVPLVQTMLGQEYVVYTCSFMVVQQVLLWTHCRHRLCSSEKLDWKKVFLNINILSLIVGALFFAGGIELPEVLGGTMEMMAAMVGPMGMLLAGMAIADVPLKQVFGNARGYLSVVLRLLVYPLVVLVCLKVCGAAGMVADGKNILLTVYLACITPACATLTSMAQLYGQDAGFCSVLYVLTTTCSIVTMPVMIGIYSMWI